jgi:CheY-like chemotaxis protein
VGVGTGLGLSICHRIIDSMGGTIDVKSVVGKGTVFRVALPSAVGAAPPTSAAPPARQKAPARRRVLVLDDEVEIGEAVERILGREHHVDRVSRGADALRLLGEHRYDLVLCDLLMPEMTGMQFYERLKAEKPEVARSVVFMSGASSYPEARSFIETVPNERIDKPFDARLLRALVEATPIRG